MADKRLKSALRIGISNIKPEFDKIFAKHQYNNFY